MKAYLKEVVDMHQIALNLTYTESTMLYNIMFELTKEFHNIDDSLDDIYILKMKSILNYMQVLCLDL